MSPLPAMRRRALRLKQLVMWLPRPGFQIDIPNTALDRCNSRLACEFRAALLAASSRVKHVTLHEFSSTALENVGLDAELNQKPYAGVGLQRPSASVIVRACLHSSSFPSSDSRSPSNDNTRFNSACFFLKQSGDWTCNTAIITRCMNAQMLFAQPSLR